MLDKFSSIGFVSSLRLKLKHFQDCHNSTWLFRWASLHTCHYSTKLITSLGIFSITLLGILWLKNVVILNYNGFKLLGWIYNLHHLTGQGYYLKSRYLEIRLIQYLPNSNKGLKKDILILPGEWHDGLPCPTREGKLGGALGLDSQFQIYPLFLYFNFCLYLKFPLTHILPTMSFCLSWWFCRPTCYCA